MKLIYGTDFHGRMDFFEKILDESKERSIDHIIIGADILPKESTSINEYYENQKEFLKYLLGYFKEYKKENPKKEIFTMLGNDDLGRLNKDMIKADKNKIIRLLSSETVHKLDGVSIIGYSYIPETPFSIKDWEKYDIRGFQSQDLFDYLNVYGSSLYETTISPKKTTIAEDLKGLAKLSNPKETIYVFHAPPKSKYLDVILSGEHVGSEAIYRFIKKHQPLLTLHGHIHESYEKTGKYREKIGNALCIQPGSNEYKKDGKLNYVVIDIGEENIETNLYEL